VNSISTFSGKALKEERVFLERAYITPVEVVGEIVKSAGGGKIGPARCCGREYKER
jgi:hypothetical protein